jgi:Ca2+-binding EF-hand superfamily protein
MFNSVDIDHKGFICYDELYLLVKVLELKEFEKESSIIKFFHQVG